MKTYIRNSVLILFMLFSVALFAQKTIIKITNYQYGSWFNDRNCGEQVDMTAYSLDGSRVFSNNYMNANGTYLIPNAVNEISIYMYAHDARDRGYKNDCGSGSTVEETLEIDVNPDPCILSGHFEFEHRSRNEVGQSVSFDYEIIPVPEIKTWLNDIAGFEDDLTLEATPDRINMA